MKFAQFIDRDIFIIPIFIYKFQCLSMLLPKFSTQIQHNLLSVVNFRLGTSTFSTVSQQEGGNADAAPALLHNLSKILESNPASLGVFIVQTHRILEPAFKAHICRSSRNSDAGSTLVTSR